MIQFINSESRLEAWEKQVLCALRSGNSIRNVDKTVAIEYIKKIIVRMLSGSPFCSKWEEDKIRDFTIGVLNCIFAEWHFLTLDEVGLSLNLGSSGRFGQLFGLSVSVVQSWLEAFVHECRKPAVEKMRSLTKGETIQIKTEEPSIYSQEWIAAVNAEFIKYTNSGGLSTFMDLGNVLHDLFAESKMLDFPESIRLEIQQKAIAFLKQEVSDGKAVGLSLADISAGENGVIARKLKSIEKRLTLEKFLHQIIMEKGQFETVLDVAIMHRRGQISPSPSSNPTEKIVDR